MFPSPYLLSVWHLGNILGCVLIHLSIQHCSPAEKLCHTSTQSNLKPRRASQNVELGERAHKYLWASTGTADTYPGKEFEQEWTLPQTLHCVNTSSTSQAQPSPCMVPSPSRIPVYLGLKVFSVLGESESAFSTFSAHLLYIYCTFIAHLLHICLVEAQWTGSQGIQWEFCHQFDSE